MTVFVLYMCWLSSLVCANACSASLTAFMVLDA